MKRRDFLSTVAGAGTGLLLAAAGDGGASGAEPAKPLDLALIGFGSQGRNLADAALLVPGVRFRAICDIWPYRQQYAANRLKEYKQNVSLYSDYREMLERQKGLDAVLIASPDFAHAPQAKACLEAGLHVYCETMMADTLEAARSMVQAAKAAKRLLAIGYQRRSHPCYLHVAEKLLHKAELPERITRVETRWAMGVNELRGWPQRHTLPADLLAKFGYGDMRQFRNWFWFSKYGPGLAAGLWAHQIDVANWLLGALPDSVLATGGVDYYRGRETCDNLTVLCHYRPAAGPVRSCSQVLTDSRADGVGEFEQFYGTEATIRASENPAWTAVFRDPNAPEWTQWVEQKLLVKTRGEPVKPPTSGEQVVQETGQVESYALPVLLTKPPLQPHLENFFDAVRGKATLACPADVAFRSEVLVFKALESLKTGRAAELAAADFSV
jgi:predicted dehydrogenase